MIADLIDILFYSNDSELKFGCGCLLLIIILFFVGIIVGAVIYNGH
jgi:hypothetical protein